MKTTRMITETDNPIAFHLHFTTNTGKQEVYTVTNGKDVAFAIAWDILLGLGADYCTKLWCGQDCTHVVTLIDIEVDKRVITI